MPNEEKPKCQWCGEEITMHPPTGLWTARTDVSTGYCWSNPLTGNQSFVSRHMPEGMKVEYKKEWS